MIQTYPGIIGDIEVYMKVLRAICGETDGKSMIDLMCAFAPNTPKLGFSIRSYVDVLERKLDDPNEQQFFERGNALDEGDIIHYYDVSICSDGIEHVTISDGHKLLRVMGEISDKQIIFTPLGELWMEKIPTDNPEAHRSAWYPEMLPGYACIVFPDYHKEWKVGSFFAWRCPDIEQDFERVIKLIQL